VTITFENLWDNHATWSSPCSTKGKSNFDDQCAIRIGVALAKCGYDVTQLKHAGKLDFCWFHPKEEGHILRAEEFALALDRTRISGIGTTQKIIPGAGFNKRIKGKKGIIFLKDYWARSGETTNPSGDHIDLWNGSRLTARTSYFRVQWGITWDGEWSDYHRSKEVWFWEVL